MLFIFDQIQKERESTYSPVKLQFMERMQSIGINYFQFFIFVPSLFSTPPGRCDLFHEPPPLWPWPVKHKWEQ